MMEGLCRIYSLNLILSSKRKKRRHLQKVIMDKFSEIMDTTTGHIAITIREYKSGNLQLGRVKDINEKMAFVNADIREGRTYEKRRMLAVAFMDEIKGILTCRKIICM